MSTILSSTSISTPTRSWRTSQGMVPLLKLSWQEARPPCRRCPWTRHATVSCRRGSARGLCPGRAPGWLWLWKHGGGLRVRPLQH